MPNTPTTTETPAVPGPAGFPSVPSRQRRGAALLVFALLLIIALGLGLSLRQQQLQLRALAQDLAEAQVRAHAAGQQKTAELAALRARAEAQERVLAEISDAQRGDRVRVQLVVVEQLLLTANERLLLARDVAGAQKALELADARLAQLEEPRLFKLREALSGERGALGRVPRADRVTAALNLSGLIEAAAQMPLAARAPGRFESAAESSAPGTVPEESGWLARGWAQVRQALAAMFSVRKARGPAPRLLAPEQEQQVLQILLLRLEAVRVALLRGEQPLLRETCQSAARWLQQHFHGEDPAVQSALAELQRIGALPLDAPLPDISGSLDLLRMHLGAAKP